MTDTRPSRTDQCSTEGNRKVTVVYEVVHKTIYTHPCCDEGKKCRPCNDSYHPEELQIRPEYSYRRHLTDAQAEDISIQYVSQIQEGRRYISGRLEHHADIVISRWTKNGIYGSQQKRENLLSKVAADLAKTPEDIIGFNYSQKEVPGPSRSLQCRRMLMLPWLNVEVLKTTPDALLALFHCRTAYGPSEWAAFDGEQFKRHWALGHFDCDHSCKTIVLYGEEEYGSLADWDAGQIHRGDTVGFPFGILVLEAQAYLMGLLRKALDTILQGIDGSHPIRTEKWQQATATGTFRRTNDIEPWSSFTWGAFCGPAKFDLAYWASLAQSRREKAEDHLRALQCDPAYLRRSIRVVADSAQWSQISAKTKGMWLTAKICDVMESYYAWRFMEDECRHVDEICRRHGDSVCTPGRSLPPEVDQALGEFDNWVVRQVFCRTQTLLENLSMSPGFSKHYNTKPVGSSTISFESVTDNDCMAAFREDPLDWYLSRIVKASGTGILFDQSRRFYFLEKYLSACKVGERRRVDELMFGAIDDLAAVQEIANATRLRRPMAQTISEKAMRRGIGIRAHRRTQIKPSTDHMFNRVCTETGPHLLKVFQQSKPPQGLKGQAWINQQKELRSSMTAFWDSIRELKKDDYSRTDLSAKETEELLKAISADLCPEHQKAVKAEEDEVYGSMKKPQEMLTAATTVFIGEGDKPQPQTRKFDLGHVKNKKKTRPDAQADIRAEQPPCDLGRLSLEGAAPGEPIVVPRKVFQEFVCKVFPVEKTEGKQGVDWQTFVRGMTVVGCSVTNSGGGGSEVLFSHELFGKITFHKPHPEPRVDTIKLHAWAQRLQRRFGWSRERFVVASVQPSETAGGSKDRAKPEETNESKAS